MDISRRGLLRGAVALIAAPAIVRASSLMPIYVPKLQAPEWPADFLPFQGATLTLEEPVGGHVFFRKNIHQLYGAFRPECVVELCESIEVSFDGVKYQRTTEEGLRVISQDVADRKYEGFSVEHRILR